MNEINIGDVFRHFKGNVYKVIALARDCEDLSEVVVYQNVEKGDTWVRPLDNFLETVTRDGKSIKRFEKIDE